ncbi:hypothetical protein Q8F55_005556 [Vanrija albida]|uniref:J domain-containing protein n=1 Tax=Vanrija albida TaxID=181172 RepID=A0ABR3Q1Z0_9TREE
MAGPGPSNAYYARFAQGATGPIHPPRGSEPALLEPTESAEAFVDAAASESLYAVLNVPSDASLAEIKDSYRSLASIYHPDKQTDDVRRAAAHARFTAIQRAHEVLTDTGTRTIYDLYGEEGLRTSWEVGPKNMSAARMREHYARQAGARWREEAEALVNSKGDMSITLDARAVFLPEALFEGLANADQIKHDVWSRAQRVQTGQVVLKHSFETPVNDRTQLVMEGTMATRGGAGGANLTGTLRHQFSPRLWAQYSQTLLSPRISTVKGTYTVDENTYVTATAISQTWLAPPRITASLGRRIYPETTGYITYKTGFWSLGPWGAAMPDEMRHADESALSIGLTNATVSGTGWTAEAQTGMSLADNYLSADWSTHALGLTLKAGVGLELQGGHVFADATAHVTEHTYAGATFQVFLHGGFQVNLHISRVGQKLALPILLAADYNPYIIFVSTVLPAAGYAAWHHFYLLPRKQQRIAKRIEQLREEHADYIAQKRIEAEEALLLMERSVQAKVQAERERDGLVILVAQYGRADDFTVRGIRDNGAIIDVTVPVQALVQNSRLFIPGARNKFNLLGFYDPCIGENKKLRVRYLFRGKIHEATVDDVGSLRAPVKSHVLED